MLAQNLRRLSSFQTPQLFFTSIRSIGKTESKHKFKTPTMRMRNVRPVFPPPGLALKPPADLDVTTFFRQIGGECEEYADQFETIDEVFEIQTSDMKKKGIPTH